MAEAWNVTMRRTARGADGNGKKLNILGFGWFDVLVSAARSAVYIFCVHGWLND
jgi:hypothetical protein